MSGFGRSARIVVALLLVGSLAGPAWAQGLSMEDLVRPIGRPDPTTLPETSAQDDLESLHDIRTIELRFDNPGGYQTYPANGATNASLWSAARSR